MWLCSVVFFFFFKQKTAYEIRISDWSSDVCSSDLFNERLMQTGFWGLNAGLVLMIFTSLLPVGLFQFEASVTTGMWYARSDEFLQQGFLETLRWIDRKSTRLNSSH